jgi:hypothetical protein
MLVLIQPVWARAACPRFLPSTPIPSSCSTSRGLFGRDSPGSRSSATALFILYIEFVFLSLFPLSHWHRGAAGAKNFGFSAPTCYPRGRRGEEISSHEQYPTVFCREELDPLGALPNAAYIYIHPAHQMLWIASRLDATCPSTETVPHCSILKSIYAHKAYDSWQAAHQYIRCKGKSLSGQAADAN